MSFNSTIRFWTSLLGSITNLTRVEPRQTVLAGVILAAALVSFADRPLAAEPGTFQRGMHAGREYRLFVPAAIGEGESLPLIVALHGCWQTPEDFAIGTRLNQAAEQRRFFALYPAQSHAANPMRCWNWFDPRHQSRASGESAEILAIVAEVQRAHRIRSERLMVLGFSAGGFMAVNLVCLAPDLWSGIGASAGGPYRCGVGIDGGVACMRSRGAGPDVSVAACEGAGGRRPRAIRASLWHGAEDSVVSATNLDGLAAMFARLTHVSAWTTSRDDGVTHAVYRDGEGRAMVETWLVSKMGHAWSGGDARGTHTFPAGPDATHRILDFLFDETPSGPSRSDARQD